MDERLFGSFSLLLPDTDGLSGKDAKGSISISFCGSLNECSAKLGIGMISSFTTGPPDAPTFLPPKRVYLEPSNEEEDVVLLLLPTPPL